MTVEQLAKQINARLIGDGQAMVVSVGTIELAEKNQITFITKKKFVEKLKNSDAAAVIVAQEIETLQKPQLVVKDAGAALIEALTIFAPKLKAPPAGIDKTAVVAQDVTLGEDVSISQYAVIDDGVKIDSGTVIGSGCKIGANSKIGKNCRLDSNVVIHHNCTLGNNVIIQANSTIGATGFGYSLIDGAHKLIPHNGVVVIDDCVEIGANSCIDRAKFGETRIGAGTKIDNLVQIAHNVVIGKCCLIASLVGIAGSTKLGDGVVLAGQSGIKDNVKVGDNVIAMAQAAIVTDVEAGKVVFGTPATDKTEAFRTLVLTKKLPKIVKQVQNIISRVETLEAAKDDKK